MYKASSSLAATGQEARFDDALLVALSSSGPASLLSETGVETSIDTKRDPEVVVGRPSAAYLAAMRAFDIVGALVGLLVLSPLLVSVAMLVAVTSPGPIFYGSPRLGSSKPTFRAWKFRSMHLDADDRLIELLERDSAARREYDEFRKLKEDPRITGIGRFIRVSSIDELPQLFNILIGEMSIVGPRPKLLNEREKFGDALPLVLSVKPGLTGLWQVSGRNNLTVTDRVRLDVQYVSERSFMGDLGICFKTVVQMWRPKHHGAI